MALAEAVRKQSEEAERLHKEMCPDLDPADGPKDEKESEAVK